MGYHFHWHCVNGNKRSQIYGKWQILTPPHVKSKPVNRLQQNLATDDISKGTPQTKFGTDPSSGGFWADE